MLFFFRSEQKAGSYLLASADDANDTGDADNAKLAKTLLSTLTVFYFYSTVKEIKQ
jgi:hypothetical protein